VKKPRFQPNVREEVRAIEQNTALNILHAIHRYAETGAGKKPLSGEFEGLLRLRVGNHRVFFEETAAMPTAEGRAHRQRNPNLLLYSHADRDVFAGGHDAEVKNSVHRLLACLKSKHRFLAA